MLIDLIFVCIEIYVLVKFGWVTALLLFGSYVSFIVGWLIFCCSRGYNSLNIEQRNSRYTYDIEELYAIGNPFNSYTGRSNF